MGLTVGGFVFGAVRICVVCFVWFLVGLVFLILSFVSGWFTGLVFLVWVDCFRSRIVCFVCWGLVVTRLGFAR